MGSELMFSVLTFIDVILPVIGCIVCVKIILKEDLVRKRGLIMLFALATLTAITALFMIKIDLLQVENNTVLENEKVTLLELVRYHSITEAETVEEGVVAPYKVLTLTEIFFPFLCAKVTFKKFGYIHAQIILVYLSLNAIIISLRTRDNLENVLGFIAFRIIVNLMLLTVLHVINRIMKEIPHIEHLNLRKSIPALNGTAAIFYVFYFFRQIGESSIINESEKNNLLSISDLINILALIIAVSLLLYIFYKYIRSISAKKSLEEQLHVQVELYEQLEKKNEVLYRIRHDYNNNIECVQSLLRNGKNEEAMRYLSEISGNICDTRRHFNSGNLFLDGILSNKNKKAKKAGARVFFDGAFPGDGIEYIDICAIFTNALDNSVEACEKIPGDGKRIEVTSKITREAVFVRIENPVIRKEEIYDGNIRTTKEDKFLHGFGLINIKNAVAKYDGSVTQQFTDDGKFELVFNLNFKKAQEAEPDAVPEPAELKMTSVG